MLPGWYQATLVMIKPSQTAMEQCNHAGRDSPLINHNYDHRGWFNHWFDFRIWKPTVCRVFYHFTDLKKLENQRRNESFKVPTTFSPGLAWPLLPLNVKEATARLFLWIYDGGSGLFPISIYISRKYHQNQIYRKFKIHSVIHPT